MHRRRLPLKLSLLDAPSGIRTHVSRVCWVKNECLTPTKLQLPIHIVDCCCTWIHVVLLGCGAALTGASAARPTTGHNVYMSCVPAQSVCSIHDQGVCWTCSDCFSSFKLGRSLKDHAARPGPVPERALADVTLVTAQIARSGNAGARPASEGSNCEEGLPQTLS